MRCDFFRLGAERVGGDGEGGGVESWLGGGIMPVNYSMVSS